MRTLSGILFALLLAPSTQAQDEAKVPDLIRKLEDDNFEVRDQAQKELTGLGETALPALRKVIESGSASGELKLRAGAAIRDIQLAQKASRIYWEPKRLTLSFEDTEIRKVLEEIARRAEVKIDASAIDGGARVSLQANDAPLFQVLDALCAGQAERTFEYREEGLIRFARDRHVPCPTAYVGPFRIRVKSINVTRNTDFKTHSVSVYLIFDADYEKYLKPSRAGDVVIARATDDKGSAIEVKAGAGAGHFQQFGGGRIIVQARFGGMVEAGPSFVLSGVDPQARKLTLEGTASFTFPIESREIKFENPAGGETREAGDTTLQTRRLGTPGLWNISFRKTKGGAEAGWGELINQRLDLQSLVAVDQDGTEFPGTFMPMHASGVRFVDQNSDPVATYQTHFARPPTKALKELRFRFIEQTFVKSVPFKLESFDLP